MEKSAGTKSVKNPSRQQVSLYWLPVIVWMGIIFLLSERHSVTVSPEYFLNFLFFKTLHIIEYATLFVLTFRASSHTGGKSMQNTAYVRAYIITVLYAMTDEMHQQFVPSRQAAPRDVIIDAIGAGLAWYYLSTQLPKAPEILRSWAKRLAIPY